MALMDIAQLLTAVAAIGAVVVGWRNGRGIRSVHELTNSRLDQLIEEVRKTATEAGRKQGRAER